METLRTPDDRFSDLPDFPYAPHYTDVPDGDGGTLRIAHVEAGSSDGRTILCIHGQPTWSFLYRKMMPLLTAEGLRVVAPDLVGFGRSDKPTRREDFSYNRQVEWMGAWLVANDLKDVVLVCQDWGGLIGLRMVADHPARFAGVVAANTGLPLPQELPEDRLAAVQKFLSSDTPTPTMPEMMQAISSIDPDARENKFAYWQKWTWETEDFPVGMLMGGTAAAAGAQLSPEEIAAYDAPFPDAGFKMGARAMPSQVPMLPTAPCVDQQRAAWRVFAEWDKPFLCSFTSDDPVTRGGDAVLKERIPGAQGMPHRTIEGGGHFLQETRPEEFSRAVLDLVQALA